MAIQPRSSSTSDNQEPLALLESLLDAPLSPSARLQPIALRSTSEQRRHALRHYTLRNWVDHLLHRAERVLLLITLLVFGYWFVDGPLRDWAHGWQQPVRASTPAIAASVPQPTEEPHAALLPYTVPGTPSRAPDVDFIAPRSNAATVSQGAHTAQPERLQIPAISLDTPIKEVFIVDGVWEVAEYAAGYLHGTALPDANSNTVLAGHAGVRGAVFRDLGMLAAGDDIFLEAGGWRYHYRVRTLQSVWPNQVEVLNASSSARLTLLTCTNWDTQRLVVVADLVDSKPTPGS